MKLIADGEYVGACVNTVQAPTPLLVWWNDLKALIRSRPGNVDFLDSGTWLVSQFKQIGVRWNRLAFSWVLMQPRMEEFNWAPYDRIVEACNREGIIAGDKTWRKSATVLQDLLK